MKFFHISDLHIGKQLGGYDISEQQKDMLRQIVESAAVNHPDAILIAGDIYDRSVPSGEAHEMLDSFLCDLSDISPSIPVMIIAGNHDSPQRLKFASSFLEKHNIYIAALLPNDRDDHIKRIVLEDEYGEVSFFLFPFIKPSSARNLAEAEEPGTGKDIRTYEDAFRYVIGREDIDFSGRNVILAHQFFVSGGVSPERSDSEVSFLSVGGIDNIDIQLIKDFDYAALGHIHGPQRVGQDNIRYSGSPWKYSVSEEHHKKGIMMITLNEKGSEIIYENIPIDVRPDVRRIKGNVSEILSEGASPDYVSIILTDERPPERAREMLSEAYSHILDIRVDNTQTRSLFSDSGESIGVPGPFEAFLEFYEEMNGSKMPEDELEELSNVIAET